MKETNSVRYFYDKTTDMELIFCSNSTISYPLHNHVSVFTIGLLLSGSIDLTIGGCSSIYRANEVFTISPYIPHLIKAGKPYSLLTLCIQKNAVQNSGKAKIKNNVRQLLGALRGFKLFKPQMMQLLNSLDLIRGSVELHFREPSMDFLRSQLEYSPERQLSLEEMSRISHISKYHFIRTFKQVIGLTPHQFQIQNRIRKAQHMLQGVEPLTEVALTTGFCDQSHFIKHFEKYLGLAPSAYRHSCRFFKSGLPD